MRQIGDPRSDGQNIYFITQGWAPYTFHIFSDSKYGNFCNNVWTDLGSGPLRGYILIVVNRNLSTDAGGKCPRPAEQSGRRVRIEPRGGQIGDREADGLYPVVCWVRRTTGGGRGSVGKGEMPEVAGS